MIYFDWKINFVEIIISLIIIILTTGITYYLFSVLPAKRRKKSLNKRLATFRNELYDFMLANEDEFRRSYELYEEEENTENENGEEVVRPWNLINIKDWSRFLSIFRYMLLLDIEFNDYWQGYELILLINNFIMDDKKYIDLSMKLSRLAAEIKNMKELIGNKADNIWEIKHKNELIKTKRDNELISFGILSLENIQEISHEIVQTIDKILNNKKRK